MKRLVTAAAISLALAIGLAPGSAAADSIHERGGLLDRRTQDRAPQLSFWAIAPWEYGLVGYGGAIRFAIPIVPQGFIPKLNDSFELELGGDFYYSHTYEAPALVVPVEARWTFHVTPRFSAYGKIGAGFRYGWEHDPHYLHMDFAPGVIFEPNERIALRAEVGYAGGRLGIGINF